MVIKVILIIGMMIFAMMELLNSISLYKKTHSKRSKINIVLILLYIISGIILIISIFE